MIAAKTNQTRQADTADDVSALRPRARACALEAAQDPVGDLAAELAARLGLELAACDELVERLADAVAARLGPATTAAPLIVDANELAEILGLTAATVRRHAVELGAIRPLGGKRGRLRFDVDRARAAWTSRSAGERSHTAGPAQESRGPVRRRRPSGTGADLLPIRGAHVAAEDVYREAPRAA